MRATVPEDGLVEIDGRPYVVVPDIDRMAPFLMSVVSDGDRWMFVSSTGTLTAGRRDATRAVFPYETDDRLHLASRASGPVTRIRVPAGGDDGAAVWHPYGEASPCGSGRRRLLKSVTGDTVVFEEWHAGLGLRFTSAWSSAEAFGFVRTTTITDLTGAPRRIELLDGVRGIVPYGIAPALQQRLSNLANAYRRSEVVAPPGRLALHTLESPVGDGAEPEEVLRATAAWSVGLDGASLSVDPDAVRRFDDGVDEPSPSPVTGRPGAHLLRAHVELGAGATVTWRIVLDVGLDHAAVVDLARTSRRPGVDGELGEAVRATGRRLDELMARSDAQQRTGDPVATAHHVANVTYNVMRGGVPLDDGRIGARSFAGFVARRNRAVADRFARWLEELAPVLSRRELLDRAAATGDPHLRRLALEYLPFGFSRRHGDPSRPWNEFSIRVQDDAGEPVLHYEGNWRDVFQNWEALASSHPEYLPGMLAVFLDASTPDGHNPYRITSDGIDWEVPDPDDPWANIGYWGDHQIVYLLRLLQATDRYLPDALVDLARERCFTYADVPYRIADYADMVRSPRSTIRFDADADARVRARMHELGGDGALVRGDDGEVVVVGFVEKLLVPALAKLSNFVPGGGIWMNTQRPEWNDANNALVGHGLSVVTACHLRQYARFLADLARRLADGGDSHVAVSSEVARWAAAVRSVFAGTPVLGPTAGDADRIRKEMMDRLGGAATEYRRTIADDGFSGATSALDTQDVVELCAAAIAHLDATLQGAMRSDGLADSYRLVVFSADGGRAAVEALPLMLEGQVAMLGAGVLDAGAQADLVDALFESELYRPDQSSFMLAPVRRLPPFLDKNVIPPDALAADPLLARLVADGDRSVVLVDADGRARFHADLTDVAALGRALDRLAATDRWAALVGERRSDVCELYGTVFGHRAFLGRSGSMYAYEGIGSIYWHMVTKLLLAVQEAAVAAHDTGDDPAAARRLADAYRRVRAGLGFHKSAAEFGAVPTDPYSHTPAHAGAQQPGMTGAVKESMLARPLELGVRVVSGRIAFDPVVLQADELLDAPTDWEVRTVGGRRSVVTIPADAAALTVCQVPVVVGVGPEGPVVVVHHTDGRTVRSAGAVVDAVTSAEVFGRTGTVAAIHAVLPAGGR